MLKIFLKIVFLCLFAKHLYNLSHFTTLNLFHARQVETTSTFLSFIVSAVFRPLPSSPLKNEIRENKMKNKINKSNIK